VTDDPLDYDQARAALDSVTATRARIAEVGVCPPWRHAAFGAVMALLILGAGLPLAVQSASLVLAMAATVWLVRWDRRRYGYSIYGYRKGATRPLTFALLFAMLGLLVLQIYLREHGVGLWVPFVVAAVAFAIGVAASVAWARIFRREMGA
jgi:hypothetical protein